MTSCASRPRAVCRSLRAGGAHFAERARLLPANPTRGARARSNQLQAGAGCIKSGGPSPRPFTPFQRDARSDPPEAPSQIQGRSGIDPRSMCGRGWVARGST